MFRDDILVGVNWLAIGPIWLEQRPWIGWIILGNVLRSMQLVLICLSGMEV